jgi:hypothetical protein
MGSPKPEMAKLGDVIHMPDVRMWHFGDMAGSDAEGRFQAGSRHLPVARSQAAERRLRLGYGRARHSPRVRSALL